MVVVRLGRILGGQLELLRQHRQERRQVGDDAFLERRETPHDALHDVLVLGRRRQLEGSEEALEERLGEGREVSGSDQGGALSSAGYAHDEDLEKYLSFGFC